jgi:intein-encoded DNA endonuclease-like protein
VDTIYFVTDGSPFKMEFQGPGKNTRKLVENYENEILEMVKKLNEKLHVVIHGIGIMSAGQRSRFLERLTSLTQGSLVYATEN